MGGGGEACLPRTEVIKGEGEGAWVLAAKDWAAEWVSYQAIATTITSSADIGGGHV